MRRIYASILVIFILQVRLTARVHSLNVNATSDITMISGVWPTSIYLSDSTAENFKKDSSSATSNKTFPNDTTSNETFPNEQTTSHHSEPSFYTIDEDLTPSVPEQEDITMPNYHTSKASLLSPESLTSLPEPASNGTRGTNGTDQAAASSHADTFNPSEELVLQDDDMLRITFTSFLSGMYY